VLHHGKSKDTPRFRRNARKAGRNASDVQKLLHYCPTQCEEPTAEASNAASKKQGKQGEQATRRPEQTSRRTEQSSPSTSSGITHTTRAKQSKQAERAKRRASSKASNDPRGITKLTSSDNELKPAHRLWEARSTLH